MDRPDRTAASQEFRFGGSRGEGYCYQYPGFGQCSSFPVRSVSAVRKLRFSTVADSQTVAPTYDKVARSFLVRKVGIHRPTSWNRNEISIAFRLSDASVRKSDCPIIGRLLYISISANSSPELSPNLGCNCMRFEYAFAKRESL